MRKIKGSEDYKSLHDIIKQSRDENFPDRKSLFKLKLNSELSPQSDNVRTRMGKDHESDDFKIDKLKNRFISIRVKQQIYMGEPAVALYMNDTTVKVREKLR